MSQFHPQKPHTEMLWLAELLETGEANAAAQIALSERLRRLAGTVLAIQIERDRMKESGPAPLASAEVVYLARFRPPVFATPSAPGGAA